MLISMASLILLAIFGVALLGISSSTYRIQANDKSRVQALLIAECITKKVYN